MQKGIVTYRPGRNVVYSLRCRGLYQIRAKRVACGRLVTVQAFVKNRCVLLREGVAKATAEWVNNVFNFCRWINVKR